MVPVSATTPRKMFFIFSLLKLMSNISVEFENTLVADVTWYSEAHLVLPV